MEEEGNEVVIVKNVYGDVCIRKKARRKRQKVLVQELLYDYANNTTLHGLPYITRRGLTNVEKVFWFITFIASIALCMYLISKVWFKWQTSPVIVTFSEQMVPVSMVPFPSVTLCPQSKVKVSAYNFTDEKIKLDAFLETKPANETLNATMRARFAKFDALFQICDKTFLYNEFDLTEVYPTTRADASMVKYMFEAAPNFTDIFEYCKFAGDYVSCRELFDKVLTREGICYNLNSLAADEIFRYRNLQRDYKYSYATRKSNGWSMEYGYDFVINSSFYPLPGSEGIAAPIVEAVLKSSSLERDQLCNVINSGFRVYIQHPSDVPQTSLYYYAVLHNQVSSMAISFDVLNTSESLRGYDPEVRQCYFPDERYLKYFKIYSSKNCRMECLANITFSLCQCVEFYMPHSSSNKICTGDDDDCIFLARGEMLKQESIQGNFTCHCLPSCNSVDYNAEILKTDFKLKKFINIVKKLRNYSDDSFNNINLSKIEMYFMKPRFLSMRRSELFGVTDFLANCGGLLGLFLGFSFLSLVEIIYFLSLRLCCTLKKDLEEEKAKANLEQEYEIEKY
ncbi:pickpocket protein 28-like [Helicoverpa zea]|uniref:pickpocket protein 28-like n=1 Tax=Helicoverpa zea TaxID=7113 RepID=UPI001F57F378|nr:pickpocket protein 28-like [Helicoverpa zea]